MEIHKKIELLKINKEFGIEILHEDIDGFIGLLLEERFTSKIINDVNILAKKLNLQPMIKANGIIVDFNIYKK